MLTLPTSTVGVRKDDRPAYRPFAVRVRAVRELTPHFVRVTFAGEDLAWFGTDGLDQRVKLVLPGADGTLADVGAEDPEVILAGTWYARLRALPEPPPFRTYTVRYVRPVAREIDVDMVRHDDAPGPVGPAARWLAGVRVGDEAVVVGPDVRSRTSATGIDWAPGSAADLLLAGDETAAPAICSILESLPAGRRARAFVEVPTAADVLDVTVPPGTHITWLGREGRPHGDLLVPAVQQWVGANAEVVDDARAVAEQTLDEVDVDRETLWDSPVVQVLPVDLCGRGGERCGSDFYAWFAGEAAVIRTLRRTLVSEIGVCRRRVAFMGYWRLGRAEAQ
ncbi:siderophore-interacting protein [Georgenia muralis]|uniref:NADPH-dependent ferric siderophore reductase n=1 Tax=Georgenia muralis TaxID=154117 RepID=A0A3N4Z8K6_9MICO|nr:siderophore-interacting protein [Georgenia muralis]RPF28354.1 NADPH-dependent ferric siderophore reductase [Georgenia muralis]